MSASQFGWWKNGMEMRGVRRCSGGGMRQRCRVDTHRSFVQMAIMSPLFTTYEPGT